MGRSSLVGFILLTGRSHTVSFFYRKIRVVGGDIPQDYYEKKSRG